MKSDYLKKRLIKIGIICTVILLLCGGGTFIVMNYNDTLEAQIAEIKSKTIGNETEYTTNLKQVKEAKDALEYYFNDFSNSEGSNPDNFRRDFAKNLLGKLKDQSNVVDLKFSMEPFKKNDGELSKKIVAYYTSKVTVQVSTNSDTDFYDFIKNISKSFPGNVTINSYTITRRVELNDEMLKKLTDEELAKGTVDGEVIFEWGTIMDLVDDKKGKTPTRNSNTGSTN